MKKGLLIIVVLICVGVQVWAGGGKEHTTKTPEQSQQAHVSIDNFNRITEYTKVPERIIVLSMEQAEMLAALGLADKIIMIGRGNSPLEGALPEHQPILKDKPYLTNVSLEHIISEQPDLNLRCIL